MFARTRSGRISGKKPEMLAPRKSGTGYSCTFVHLRMDWRYGDVLVLVPFFDFTHLFKLLLMSLFILPNALSIWTNRTLKFVSTYFHYVPCLDALFIQICNAGCSNAVVWKRLLQQQDSPCHLKQYKRNTNINNPLKYCISKHVI